MNKEELERAMEDTLEEIVALKKEISNCANSKMQRKLTMKLRELKYKQLWYIDLYERLAHN